MTKSLDECMTTHFNSLLLKQELARIREIFEANHDMNEFFGFVFDAGALIRSVGFLIPTRDMITQDRRVDKK